MPTYKLWQKAVVWYSAEVEANNEDHALRLHNAGLVEGWSMDLNTVQNEQEIEVQIIDGPDSFTTEDICDECGMVHDEPENTEMTIAEEVENAE